MSPPIITMESTAFHSSVWTTYLPINNIGTGSNICGNGASVKQRPVPSPRYPTGNPLSNIKCNTSVTSEETAETEVEFSTKGMTVEDFFERSVGEWRSQRSSHNLAWTQFEQITSAITIEKLDKTDDEIVKLCQANKADVNDIVFSLKMSWEGESDWDDEVSEGESIMSVIKDGDSHGRLLRSVGYAETIPAVGHWKMTEDGVFVLNTLYDAAGAEERIWFATPDLRMRVSQIRTSSGKGVMTASFSSEIRRLKLD